MHDLCNTGVILYQLSYMYEALLEAEVKYEFNLYPLYEENDMMCI